MNYRKFLSLTLSALLTLGLLTACGGAQESQPQQEETAISADAETAANADAENAVNTDAEADDGVLRIAKQGVFASGGTVTEPVVGEYNPALSWMDPTLAGTTAHVDHASVLYQIPDSGGR